MVKAAGERDKNSQKDLKAAKADLKKVSKSENKKIAKLDKKLEKVEAKKTKVSAKLNKLQEKADKGSSLIGKMMWRKTRLASIEKDLNKIEAKQEQLIEKQTTRKGLISAASEAKDAVDQKRDADYKKLMTVAGKMGSEYQKMLRKNPDIGADILAKNNVDLSKTEKAGRGVKREYAKGVNFASSMIAGLKAAGAGAFKATAGAAISAAKRQMLKAGGKGK